METWVHKKYQSWGIWIKSSNVVLHPNEITFPNSRLKKNWTHH